jgi:hypothetical protein
VNDNRVYISYSGILDDRFPSFTDNTFGGTSGNDIAITHKAFEKAFAEQDARHIAAVLLHEMEHVNGAPMTDTQAENVLIPYFKTRNYMLGWAK